jgi:hypothetical protein
MTRLLVFTLATLLAGGEAMKRTDDMRQKVGECANSKDKSVCELEGGRMCEVFSKGKVTGTLPSMPVKQAETDVVGADLIGIEYGSNYKILTEKMSKEMYVLTQCGTTPPTNAELAAFKATPAGYTVKHFTIPLQVASSASTVHLAFFKALGVEDRLRFVSEWASGPCWQKSLSCGAKHDANNFAAQVAQVDAHFMDCGFNNGPDCSNVNSEAKGIHISTSQDPGPLRSAEHIKFIAAFFNKEELASQLFASTLAAYTSASVVANPKPVVAWIAFNAKSSWAEASFVLSQASYKLKMALDAGGANVDGTAVKAQMGDKMAMASASTGKTYTVLVKSFSDDKAQASAAFFAALSQVDVIIDETYAPKPRDYNFDSFLTTMGLTSSSSLKFVKNKMVLRVDGIISEGDGLDWYESRLAHPDWAVTGLAGQIHSDKSKPSKYFRNIAKGEQPEVLTKALCTATLPACDSSTYPAPIGMMIAQVAGKAAATCLGPLLLLISAVLQA